MALGPRKHVWDKQEWEKALGTPLEGLTPDVSQPLTHPREAYPAVHISAKKHVSNIEVILDHVIPLQPTRTNVITENQTQEQTVWSIHGQGEWCDSSNLPFP
eukprot:6404364-Amphidinium_carterae.1